MKKHQFTKADCNCDKQATYYTCIHCGGMEYASEAEVEALDMFRATCSAAGAPMVSPTEKFKATMGGTVNCLAPEGALPQAHTTGQGKAE